MLSLSARDQLLPSPTFFSPRRRPPPRLAGTTPFLLLPRSIRIGVQAPRTGKCDEPTPSIAMKSFHDVPIPETSQQLSLLLLALQHSETHQSRLELCSSCAQVRLDAFHFILPLLARKRESFAFRCPFFSYGPPLPFDGRFLVGRETRMMGVCGFRLWRWQRCRRCRCSLGFDQTFKGNNFGFEC